MVSWAVKNIDVTITVTDVNHLRNPVSSTNTEKRWSKHQQIEANQGCQNLATSNYLSRTRTKDLDPISNNNMVDSDPNSTDHLGPRTKSKIDLEPHPDIDSETKTKPKTEIQSCKTKPGPKLELGNQGSRRCLQIRSSTLRRQIHCTNHHRWIRITEGPQFVNITCTQSQHPHTMLNPGSMTTPRENNEIAKRCRRRGPGSQTQIGSPKSRSHEHRTSSLRDARTREDPCHIEEKESKEKEIRN